MRIFFIILIIVFVLAIIIVVGGRIYNSNVATPNGVGTGQLAPCSEAPNCVSTLATDELHQVEPLQLTQGSAEAISQLAEILVAMPKSRVITKTNSYLHVEFRSSFWNFVDDVEFVVDEASGQIESRSAARMGYSDLGVNKARYQKIGTEYAAKAP